MTWSVPVPRGPAWFRFGLAGGLVALSAIASIGCRCDDMPGTGLVVLVLLLAVQGTTAIGSFAASVLACLRREWRRARVEALVGVAMLLAIPLALSALVSLSPGCE